MTDQTTQKAPVSSERLQRILEENKLEIGEVVREANASRSRLMKLLKIDELNASFLAWGSSAPTSVQTRVGFELQYLIDLFDAYIDSGQEPNSRLKRMYLFAENYQKHPDEVQADLAYFGLTI